MAEKKRVTKTVSESMDSLSTAPEAVEKYKPKSHMYMNLYDECCMDAGGMELGKEVTLEVTGKVRRMSETTGDTHDQSFDLDVTSVKCCEDE